MHLAGQIIAYLDRDAHSIMLVRTHRQGNFVLVDFSSYDPGDPSSQPPSYPSLLSSEGRNKPSTLSLSACCRIVEEHGGRLLQTSTPRNSAFRIELQLATNSASRTSLDMPNRTAARSGS
jgi:hypothetical protein